ncbi:hypothetical protein KCU71_g7510, partial [Aureobasidium melanogenum]
MRTLFLNNASSILSAVCRNENLLSAAKVLVDTISEVAKRPGVFCACSDLEDYHFHKNVANQRYVGDASAPFPTELHDLRTLSWILRVAMLVADKAVEFWAAKITQCEADHERLAVDKEKFAQAYLLLWYCAECHFSPQLDARMRELGARLLPREIRLLREVYDFSSFDLDRPTKLRVGSADPDADEEDIEAERPWFMFGGGRREDLTMDMTTNSAEWWFWNPMYGAWRSVRISDRTRTEWERERPEKCLCLNSVLIKWDLVQLDWWHTWDRTT